MCFFTQHWGEDRAPVLPRPCISLDSVPSNDAKMKGMRAENCEIGPNG